MNVSRFFQYLPLLLLCAAAACGKSAGSANPTTPNSEPEPLVRDNGTWIEFPAHSRRSALFTTRTVGPVGMTLQLDAPATVVARVKHTGRAPAARLVLFHTPDLSGVYSSYLQTQTLLHSRQVNCDRVRDLRAHGASTGRELEEIVAEVQNLRTVLAENEAKLREAGLSPDDLQRAAAGTVWLICDLPEAELNLIRKGQRYSLEFPSFPHTVFRADIDAVTEVLNSQTRKLRIRLSLNDGADRLRPGMYATVRFASPHAGMMVPKRAVFSTNARYYVFVRHGSGRFERRVVSISTEAGDTIEIAAGVRAGEEVVCEHTYLLKGLSSGI